MFVARRYPGRRTCAAALRVGRHAAAGTAHLALGRHSGHSIKPDSSNGPRERFAGRKGRVNKCGSARRQWRAGRRSRDSGECGPVTAHPLSATSAAGGRESGSPAWIPPGNCAPPSASIPVPELFARAPTFCPEARGSAAAAQTPASFRTCESDSAARSRFELRRLLSLGGSRAA